jgi:hypothetical protein
MLGFHGYNSKLHALVSIVTTAMLAYCNPLLSKAAWSMYYIHLKILNVRHFEMVEATELKIWHPGHFQYN